MAIVIIIDDLKSKISQLIFSVVTMFAVGFLDAETNFFIFGF